MTLERDIVASELFGLAGSFPHPGWAVLDAARNHGFTGELTFDSIPATKVYLDSGEIYLAERVTDPPLGSRLVDAGALNAAQLEHGQMYVGEIAHLGRLFERVPSVNRDSVLLVTEMMTEECVGWLAGQLVRDATAAPYHHHPAGIQRWLRPVPAPASEFGDPLPAPTIDAGPVDPMSDQRPFSPVEPLDDGMIEWHHPLWLDDHPPKPAALVVADPETDSDPASTEAEPAATLTTDPLDWSQPDELHAEPAAPTDEPIVWDTEPTEPTTDEPAAPTHEPIVWDTEPAGQAPPERVTPAVEPAAPTDEPAEPDAGIVEQPAFTVQDDSSADPVASTQPATGDVAWLTSPPSFADAASQFDAPVGLEDPGFAAPIEPAAFEPDTIDASPAWPEPAVSQPEPTTAQPEPTTAQADPITAEPEAITAQTEPITAQTEAITAQTEPITAQAEPITAQPEPAVITDDWADLVAAVADAEADTEAEVGAAPASLGADQASPAVEPPPESATADSDPAAEVVEIDPPTEPSPSVDPLDAWPPVVPTTTDWAAQLESPSTPEPSAQMPTEPEQEQEPAVLPVRSTKATPAPALSFGDEQPDTISEFEDWVDRLDTDGLPDAGTDLLGTTKRLPPTPAQVDRFEVIWPSGEVDEQFGAVDSAPVAGAQPDLDRVGATARLKTGLEQPFEESDTGDEVTDEVVLAVRRAVATIETGSLAARRRLVTTPHSDDPSRGVDQSSERVLTPLRHDPAAVEHAMQPTASTASHRAPTRSVFDDDLPIAAPVTEPVVNETVHVATEQEVTRTGALRRLIGSLRRR